MYVKRKTHRAFSFVCLAHPNLSPPYFAPDCRRLQCTYTQVSGGGGGGGAQRHGGRAAMAMALTHTIHNKGYRRSPCLPVCRRVILDLWKLPTVLIFYCFHFSHRPGPVSPPPSPPLPFALTSGSGLPSSYTTPAVTPTPSHPPAGSTPSPGHLLPSVHHSRLCGVLDKARRSSSWSPWSYLLDGTVS